MKKKRSIAIEDFVKDVRSGMADYELMERYRLTGPQLQSLYGKLIDRGKLELSDLEDDETSTLDLSDLEDDDAPTIEPTVEMSVICPHCGGLKQENIDNCPHCGEEDTLASFQLYDSLDQDTPAEGASSARSSPMDISPPSEADLDFSDLQDKEFVLDVSDEFEPLREAGEDEPPYGPTPSRKKSRRKIRIARRRPSVALVATVILLAVTGGLVTAIYTEMIKLPKELPFVSSPQPGAVPTRPPRLLKKKPVPTQPKQIAKRAIEPDVDASEAMRTSPEQDKVIKAQPSSKERPISEPHPTAKTKITAAKPSEDLDEAQDSVREPITTRLESRPIKEPARVESKDSVSAASGGMDAVDSSSTVKSLPSRKGLRKTIASRSKHHITNLRETVTELPQRSLPQPMPDTPGTSEGTAVPGTAISARGSSSISRETAQTRARQPGAPSLFRAIEQNDRESVEGLLSQGVDVNQKDEGGYTPLMKAIKSHKEDFVRLLLNNRADVGVKAANGDTALDLACKVEDPAIVELLVPRARHESGEMLLQASKEGKKKSVELLLRGGVDVNFRDEHGNTPLMIASGKGRLAVIQALLDHGADIHAENKQGITALGWAYSPELTGQLPFRIAREVVRMLKQHGAKSTASFRPR